MRPTEAAPPLVRLPARPWVGGDTTAELEAPTAPLPIALDRERTPASPDRERLTMSVAPPANAPFGPPIRVDAPTPRPRAPSQTSRRPLSREPSRPPRNNTQVRVPSGAMRIFRADTNQDEFTRQGGIYWRFHEQKGRIQFNQPGALVMIVRDRDDTVRCYSLVHDLRC